MQCWFVEHFEFCVYLQARIRIYFNFSFAAQLKCSLVRVEIRALGRRSPNRLTQSNAKFYLYITRKCTRLVWMIEYVFFLGYAISWVIDNVQLIKFFATGSNAVLGDRRSACRMTFSSPLAIRGGGLANDWRWLCMYIYTSWYKGCSKFSQISPFYTPECAIRLW